MEPAPGPVPVTVHVGPQMAESPAPPAAVEQPRKKQRGVKGLPRGVTGPNQAGKYVARASFKRNPESKAEQRNLGSFESGVWV